MEGVLILNTFEVVERAPGWTWWALIPIAITIGCFILSCYFNDNSDAGGNVLFGFFAMVSVVICCLMICSAKELPPETHYQVVVDSDVNFVEFTNKYEVIEQEGAIYTVIEKE
jgi:hypothetical protein